MKNLNISYRRLNLTFDKFSWIALSTIENFLSVSKALKTDIEIEGRVYDLYRNEGIYRLVPRVLYATVETIILKTI